MENDEELDKIRQKRLAELQQQALSQQHQEEAMKAQQEEFEAQKYALLRKILDPEARSRLQNIKMVRPQFAETIEMQLIQLVQTGQLRGQLPITDTQLKAMLKRMTGKKKDIRIRKIG